MNKHEWWKKIEEVRLKGQTETNIEENGSDITIHIDEMMWYPEYY